MTSRITANQFGSIKMSPLVLLAVLGCASINKPRLDVQFDATPDGKTIIFSTNGASNSSQELYALYTDTLKVSPLTKSNGTKGAVSSANSNGDFVYARYTPTAKGGNSELVLCDLNTRKEKVIFKKSQCFINSCKWVMTKKKSQIIFSSANVYRSYSMGGHIWDDYFIYSIMPNGSQVKRLTKQSLDRAPAIALSPVQDEVVCSTLERDMNYKGTVRMYKTSALAVSRVSPLDLLSGVPFIDPKHASEGNDVDFSAKGNMIALTSDMSDSFNYDVWLVDILSGRARQLTHSRSYITSPRFAKSDTEIWYLSDPSRRGRHELWRMKADGTGQTKIAGPELFDDPLHWKP